MRTTQAEWWEALTEEHAESIARDLITPLIIELYCLIMWFH